jgi:N-acetylneuraminate synthase
MQQITIGDRDAGPGEPPYVIAEAGSNHNGDFDLAKKLVDAAASAGADAIKFQTFRAEDLYVRDSGKADYLEDERSIFDIIEAMEMPYEWIELLHDYCERRSIVFLSTPFDERSADELAQYVPAFKIASFTMSHHPFLLHLAEKGLPVIISTGAHEFQEVVESVGILRDAGLTDLVLLQCVSSYPTPMEEINLRVIETLREELNLNAGLSDHTQDPILAPVSAVSLGAAVVEKHLTLDRGMDGPDHEFAIEPRELEQMVKSIRAVESALGSGEKSVLDIERELHDVARRRIHATRDIRPGETLTEDNVAVLRSGKQANGLEPKFYEDVLGRKAIRDIQSDAGINWDDVGE